MLPGQTSYTSTNRNSIITSSYGSWSGTYRFVQPTTTSSGYALIYDYDPSNGLYKNNSGQYQNISMNTTSSIYSI